MLCVQKEDKVQLATGSYLHCLNLYIVAARSVIQWKTGGSFGKLRKNRKWGKLLVIGGAQGQRSSGHTFMARGGGGGGLGQSYIMGWATMVVWEGWGDLLRRRAIKSATSRSQTSYSTHYCPGIVD